MTLSLKHVWSAVLVLACIGAAATAVAQPTPPATPRPSVEVPVVPPPNPGVTSPFEWPSPRAEQPNPPVPFAFPGEVPTPFDVPQGAQRPQKPQTPPPGQPGPAPAPGRINPVAQPTPAPPAPAGPPPPPGQPVNVKIELTISDETGSAAPIKKIVSMTVGDREYGQIRSTAWMPGSPEMPMPGGLSEVPLNIDARPVIQGDGKLRVSMTINYDSTGVPITPGGTTARKIQIREQLGFILESGKPLIVSQSADPLGDRKVTVEVKATILR